MDKKMFEVYGGDITRMIIDPRQRDWILPKYSAAFPRPVGV